MGTQGNDLLESIRSMRNLLNDISQLLSTADSLMGAESWENVGGSGCLSEMSYSVNAGHLWMPREATRSYRKSHDYHNLMAMITVLIDNFQRDYKLSEPIVSASYFVFAEDSVENNLKLDFWQCKWFGWCEAKPDGSIISIDETDPEWRRENVWKYMQVFGHPLIEITNETFLKEKIIDPLLQVIDSYWDTTHQ